MSAKPPTLHLEIDAVWLNGKWRLVDENGSPCQPLTKGVLAMFKPKKTRASHALLTEWRQAITKWGQTLRTEQTNETRRCDPWNKRLASMSAMVRQRRQAGRNVRERTTVGGSWPERIAGIKRNLTHKAKHARANGDEWTRWCRGHASGMQKRAASR